MYENIRLIPFIKYKCSLYFGSTYSLLNLIYYSIIFLFTDNNDVLSQTANCDFFGCSSRLVQIPSGTEKVGTLNLVAPQILIMILMHD